jgi:hypothetical protein
MEKLTVQKTIIRFVTCERCGCAYEYYVLARNTISVERPKGITGNLADLIENDARNQDLRTYAYSAIHEKLAIHRAVACPECRWYQPNMSRAYGLRRLMWAYYIGVTWLVVSGAMALGMIELTGPATDDAWEICAWGMPVVATLGGVLLYLRHVCAARYNLNAEYPNHIAPLAGEPLAIRRPLSPKIVEGTGGDAGVWYAARGGRQFGPYSWNELYDLAVTGKLLGDDYVVAPNAVDWVEARTISELGLQ